MKPLGFKQRDDDLVILTKFNQALEAHSLRILLEASGIQAVVSGEESNSLIGLPMLPAGTLGAGVEVRVRREDLESAELVMNEVPAASEELIPEWTCRCGELVDRGFSVCWSCGAEHVEDSEDGSVAASSTAPAAIVPSSREVEMDELARIRGAGSSSGSAMISRILFGVGFLTMLGAYFLPLEFQKYAAFVFLGGAIVGVFGALRLAMKREGGQLKDGNRKASD